MNAVSLDPRRILLNDFVAQWHDTRAEALAAMERVGESGWLILGEELRQFETELAATWGLPHAVGCGNGLDAIEIGLRALCIEPGDRVLTTPLSAFATTLAIVRAGGLPVFVDTDASGLVDLERAAQVLTEEPSIRYFVPVHLYGHALDALRLDEIMRRHRVRVVEDCAQAIGAMSRGKPVGSTGEVAATSFYPTKNLGCMGDGGAVLTHDPAIAETARCLRDYGQAAKYVHARLGLNSRLDELQAAILRSAQLPHLGRHMVRRRAVAETYRRRIRNAALSVPPTPDGSSSVWHLFPVLVEGDRTSFGRYLEARGIMHGLHYPLLIPDQKSLAGVRFEVHGELTNSRRFADRELSLPIHPYLTDDDVERVIRACNEWHP